jgi:ribonuclease E
VQLRSGGYIVINQTEALVSIDVNSGRATREHHIEDTALKTNLEASEEVARQLRLRDLAGLIVIDFIDMDEKRNNRAVERKLSDCLRQDRARIQVGRISHFGLLEMSRQRIRASVLESSTEPCPQCGGTGHVRSVSSVALQLLRGIEEILMKGATHNLVVRTRTDVALYVLNHKRGHLRDLENAFKVTLSVVADPTVSGQQSFVIERGEQVHTLEAAKALLVAQAAASPPPVEEAFDEDDPFDLETETEVETEETEGLVDDLVGAEAAEGEGGPEAQRRKRRRRRRGRGSEAREAGPLREGGVAREGGLAREDEAVRIEAAPIADIQSEEGEADEDDTEEQPSVARTDQSGGERRPRRRGRRGGRRRRGGAEDGLAGSIADELAPPSISEAEGAVADFDGVSSESSPSIAQAEALGQQPHLQPSENGQSGHDQALEHSQHETTHASAQEEAAQEAEKAARRRSTVREKVSFLVNAQPEAAAPVNLSPEPAPAPTVPAPAPAESTPEAVGDNQPRRAGWWSRRFGNGE